MGIRDPRTSKHYVPNPITVSRCHVQTAKDRFGNDGHKAVLLRDGAMRRPVADYPFTHSSQDNWPYYSEDPDFEGPELADSSMWKRVPTMQKYRNNLTALSQDFNLYFVAYRNRIFVYRPTSIARQRLNEHPELQLLAPETSQGKIGGGYIEPHVPQTINAIKVGHLGDQEVLVTVHDNGDVNIWMTELVAKAAIARHRVRDGADPEHVSDSNMSSLGHVSPFHTTHVGISAWGIDIHRQSRLIAVSTNTPEVVVIAPGLKNDKFFTSRHKAKRRLPLRDDTCHISLQLGPAAQNIPNVCFLDDMDGDAEKVCAEDIGGNTWVADIWEACWPPYRISYSSNLEYMRSEEFYPNRPRGWGVLVIPESSFMEVKHLTQLVGLDLPNRAPRLPGESHPYQQRLFEFRGGWLGLPEYPVQGVVWGPRQPVNRLHGQFSMTYFQGFSNGFSQAASADSHGDDEDQDSLEEEEMENTGGGTGTVLVADLDEQLAEAITLAQAMGNASGPSLLSGSFPEDDTESEGSPALSDTLRNDHLCESEKGSAGSSLARKNRKGPTAAVSAQEQSVDKAAQGTRCTEQNLFMPWDPFSELETEGSQDLESGQVEGPFKYVPVANMRRDRTTGEVTNEWYGRLELQPRARTPGAAGVEAGDRKQRVQILRTYEDSIEMRCLDENRTSDRVSLKGNRGFGRDRPDVYNCRKEKEIGIVCDKVMPLGLFRRPRWNAAFKATGRLNMIFHIPELQLVVIGSATGRVALVTPTKLKERLHPGGSRAFWQHGFQVEMVLPRSSEEERFRQTPWPLHGIAVAPLQESTELRVTDPVKGRTREQMFPTKFRLVLHYRDHSIWTYVLSRSDVRARDIPIL